MDKIFGYLGSSDFLQGYIETSNQRNTQTKQTVQNLNKNAKKIANEALKKCDLVGKK